MITLEAPFPAIEATSVLPAPRFSDQERSLASVSRKFASDGTRYTYVRRRDRRRLNWTFLLSRPKALELRAFLMAHFASKVRITDHKDRVWVGYFTSNPFDFETARRGAPAITPMPRGELVTINLEFEGVQHA